MSHQRAENPLGGFAALLSDALGDLLKPGASSFLEMISEDVVMEFPYAPPGSVRRLEGRTEVEAHLERVSALLDIQAFSRPVVHRAAPSGVVVVEFSCQGRAQATDEPYNQDYISVITVRDGKIARYRDYWNPLVALQALGGPDEMTRALPAERGS